MRTFYCDSKRSLRLAQRLDKLPKKWDTPIFEARSILKEDLKNERKHMLFYLTNASTIIGLNRIEIKKYIIYKISVLLVCDAIILWLNTLKELVSLWCTSRVYSIFLSRNNWLCNYFRGCPFLALHYRLIKIYSRLLLV